MGTQDLTINLMTGEDAGGSWTGLEHVTGTLGSGNDDVTVGMQLLDLDGGGGVDHITLDYSGALADGRTVTQLTIDPGRSRATKPWRSAMERRTRSF